MHTCDLAYMFFILWFSCSELPENCWCTNFMCDLMFSNKYLRTCVYCSDFQCSALLLVCQANYLHNCVQHLFLYNTVIVIHRPTRGVVRVPSMICLIGPTNHLRAETTQSPSEHAATTATATGAWFSVWEQTGLSTGRQNTTVMNTIQSTAVPAIAYEKRQRWLDSVRAPNDQRVPRAAQSVSLHTTVTKKQVRVSASWWFPIEKGRGTCANWRMPTPVYFLEGVGAGIAPRPKDTSFANSTLR